MLKFKESLSLFNAAGFNLWYLTPYLKVIKVPFTRISFQARIMAFMAGQINLVFCEIVFDPYQNQRHSQ